MPNTYILTATKITGISTRVASKLPQVSIGLPACSSGSQVRTTLFDLVVALLWELLIDTLPKALLADQRFRHLRAINLRALSRFFLLPRPASPIFQRGTLARRGVQHGAIISA